MAIKLTNENYYTDAANKDYMSVSQFKDFAGTQGHSGCEKTALDKLNGFISEPKSTSLLVGSYIDSYFEGTLDEFRENTPELFKKTGDKGLKAEYMQAEHIINRINSDVLFSDYMSGQKQVIMTGKLFGIDWKIKMDSYHPDDKIVDLKVMKDMNPIWSSEKGMKYDFIRHWGYDIQGAVYQKIVEINTGKKLPFYIACATKETPTDIEIIEITQPYLDAALKFVEDNINRVIDIKNGKIAPTSNPECKYCRLKKVLTKPISIEDIIPDKRTSESDMMDIYEDDMGAVPHIQGYSLFD